jgi:hypothetical protein
MVLVFIMIVSFLFTYKVPSKNLFTKRNPSHIFHVSTTQASTQPSPAARASRRHPIPALGSGASALDGNASWRSAVAHLAARW